MTGANGFIGRALCDRLAAEHDVVPAVRSRRSALEVEVGDIDDETDWTAALERCDAVVHTAAHVHVIGGADETKFRQVNTLGSLCLARMAAQSGVKRLIFLSSVKAMGGAGDLDLATPCNPEDAYGISKYEAENGLVNLARQTGLEVIILRLPLVYGPGVGGNFLRLLKLVDRGIPLPLGGIINARSMLSRRNLVSAIEACLVREKPARQIYLLSDGERVSTAELIRRIAEALGKRAPLITLPTGILYALARATGKLPEADRLLGSLTVDSSDFNRDLGWTPEATFREGLEETVGWYISVHSTAVRRQ